jgi:hypothetical protein
MESEESGKTDHWKNKLGELQGLRPKVFNKEAAWNKLHVRMHEKRGKKKMAWYWAAAAILIFGLTIPLLVAHSNKSSVAGIERISKSPKENIEPLLKLEKNNISGNSQSHLHLKNNSTSKNKPTETNLAISKKLEAKIRINDTVSTQLTTEIISQILQPTTALSVIPKTLVQNKKLKVIYINELGDPVDENPATAKIADMHSFQLKLARLQVFESPGIAAKITGFTILKSKISPN